MKTNLFSLIGVLASSVLCSGCSWFSANQPAITSDVTQLVLCVASRDTEPPAQIATECGAQALQDVIIILDQLKASGAHVTMAKPVAAADAGL